ncbi:uncharacterized protein Dana_GF21289 [Drosophila ananassae]|uniref:EF-hand domain-containing protein n=1 Tax=Drosophila ananassae TaxID=7217 RepID=B3MRH9_DROAN|nr:myosin light chain 3 [Drosophila ananassae]EDV34384.2 uncharacterized protein Dana_GF21289 [Drosophila ananassae]
MEVFSEDMRSVHKFGFFHKRSELMIMLPQVPKLRDIFELFAVKVNARAQAKVEGTPAEAGIGAETVAGSAGTASVAGEADVEAKAKEEVNAEVKAEEGTAIGAGTEEQSGSVTVLGGAPTIDLSDVAECLRTMGLFPSEKWLSDRVVEQLRRREALGPLGAHVARRASFELVLTLYCQLATLNDELTADEVLVALRSCDRQRSGVLSYSELRHMLTTVGERLEEAEVFSLLHTVSDISGNVHYEHLVKKMFAKDGQTEETVHQARLYLQAIGRNAIDMDMAKRDEFIDALREADPSNTGYIDQSILLSVLNRSEEHFTSEELQILTRGMEDEGHPGINYRRFLRFIMHE